MKSHWNKKYIRVDTYTEIHIAEQNCKYRYILCVARQKLKVEDSWRGNVGLYHLGLGVPINPIIRKKIHLFLLLFTVVIHMLIYCVFHFHSDFASPHQRTTCSCSSFLFLCFLYALFSSHLILFSYKTRQKPKVTEVETLIRRHSYSISLAHTQIIISFSLCILSSSSNVSILSIFCVGVCIRIIKKTTDTKSQRGSITYVFSFSSYHFLPESRTLCLKVGPSYSK